MHQVVLWVTARPWVLLQALLYSKTIPLWSHPIERASWLSVRCCSSCSRWGPLRHLHNRMKMDSIQKVFTFHWNLYVECIFGIENIKKFLFLLKQAWTFIIQESIVSSIWPSWITWEMLRLEVINVFGKFILYDI